MVKPFEDDTSGIPRDNPTHKDPWTHLTSMEVRIAKLESIAGDAISDRENKDVEAIEEKYKHLLTLLQSDIHGGTAIRSTADLLRTIAHALDAMCKEYGGFIEGAYIVPHGNGLVPELVKVAYDRANRLDIARDMIREAKYPRKL